MLDFKEVSSDIEGKHTIYFDEKNHKYTDELGNILNSVTTIISSYHEEFDTDKMAKICAKIGRNPRHPKYFKYKGKTEKQLKKEWSDLTQVALDKGNKKHNYLEDSIKASNNYKRVNNKFINDKLFTVPDLIKFPKVGLVDFSIFDKFEIDTKYPKIYDLIKSFVNEGWKLYAEIGVYNISLLVSGLVDLLLVKDDKFVIIDWKTNKSPIRFEAGYYEKDNDGNLTDNFLYKYKTLSYPLNHLQDSVGNHYSLQLSTYAFLIEQFGFKYAGTILCHIRTLPDNTDTVDVHQIKYYKNEVRDMLQHYFSNLNLENQNKLFI